MMIVYPMLYSDSVNKQLLPGISKMLERYILLFKTNDMIVRYNKQMKEEILYDQKGIIIADLDEILQEGQKGKQGRTRRERERDKVVGREKFYPSMSKKRKDAEEYNEKYYKQDIEDMSDKDWNELSSREQQKLKQQEKRRDKEEEERQQYLDVLKDEKEEKKQKEKDRKERIRKGISDTRFDFADSKSISLEPTWVSLQIPGIEGGTVLVGVKVVPFPVKSKLTLAELMSQDAFRRMLPSLIVAVGRWVIRKVYSILRRTIKKIFPKFLSGILLKNLTGNPKKDVIFGVTQVQEDIFCILNRTEILNEEFLSNVGSVKKLYMQGWKSFLVLDDVNKMATMCMKEFNGMCSLISYSALHAALGQSDVFDKIEDVKKASSPFFRLKRMGSLFKENIDVRLNGYLQSLNEKRQILVEDDFTKILTDKQVDFAKILVDIQIGYKTGDFTSLDASIGNVPLIPMERVISIVRSKFPSKFKQGYSFNKKVIFNSLPTVDEDVSKLFSFALTFEILNEPDEGLMIDARDELKLIVNNFTKMKDRIKDKGDQTQQFLLALFILMVNVKKEETKSAYVVFLKSALQMLR